MVFNSLEYIYIFLPLVVIIYFVLNHFKHTVFSILFLIFASLFYYAYWNVPNTLIIIISVFGNFLMGQVLGNTKFSFEKKPILRKVIFIFTVLSNILALAYYKYMDFFIANINTLFNTQIPVLNILLPIGISFFTFQQIAYISDIYTGKHIAHSESFLDYCLFVCFFPQLVAGPIVHHSEMMPQFASRANLNLQWDNIFRGLVLIAIGLTKKVLIADNLSPIVQYCFDESIELSFMAAAFGSLAYTLQLYFDFSAYADLAIGSALFFNIQLPENFNSPYLSRNIQEFWRRWHMTLSRWLRDYIYIPLGGSKKGFSKTLRNVFITFLLGGFWHGAAWTFIIWGTLHGSALCFLSILKKYNQKAFPFIFSWFITFFFINITWIVFRATDLEVLSKFFQAFSLQSEFFMLDSEWKGILENTERSKVDLRNLTIFAFIISLFPYNSMKIYKNFKPRILLLLFVILLFYFTAYLTIFENNYSEFIYFQF